MTDRECYKKVYGELMHHVPHYNKNFIPLRGQEINSLLAIFNTANYGNKLNNQHGKALLGQYKGGENVLLQHL